MGAHRGGWPSGMSRRARKPLEFSANVPQISTRGNVDYDGNFAVDLESIPGYNCNLI